MKWFEVWRRRASVSIKQGGKDDKSPRRIPKEQLRCVKRCEDGTRFVHYLKMLKLYSEVAKLLL